MFKRISLTIAALFTSTLPAFAHLNPEEHGSFMAGFSHPLFGADHILAMIAVGIWASQLAATEANKKALWLVPTAFVLTMAAGFMFAMAGIELPFVEPAILASVVAFGLLITLAVKLPAAGAATIVGLFALFHGHAHGGELGNAEAMGYGVGFVIATALLHVAGIALGFGLSRLSPSISRVLGGLTAIAGLSLAFAG